MSCCDDSNNYDPVLDSIVVENNGVSLGSFTTLNFTPGLTAADAGGGVATITDTKQVFRYTATGAEANPFTVTLPAARASANYNVQITGGGPQANAIKIFRALAASFTINDFSVEASAAVQANDILMITVEDLT